MLFLKMFCMAGRGSVDTNLWGAVFPGRRNGNSELSKSLMVSIVASYLIEMSVDRRVDLAGQDGRDITINPVKIMLVPAISDKQ
jgi:hypothetical protein